MQQGASLGGDIPARSGVYSPFEGFLGFFGRTDKRAHGYSSAGNRIGRARRLWVRQHSATGFQLTRQTQRWDGSGCCCAHTSVVVDGAWRTLCVLACSCAGHGLQPRRRPAGSSSQESHLGVSRRLSERLQVSCCGSPRRSQFCVPRGRRCVQALAARRQAAEAASAEGRDM